MSSPEPIYIGCDHNVTLTGMRDAATGAYLNTGTATWTLKDASGTQISTGSLSYVAASNGNYLGVIESTDQGSGLTELATYYVYIAFTQGNYDDERRLTCEARYREEN